MVSGQTSHDYADHIRRFSCCVCVPTPCFGKGARRRRTVSKKTWVAIGLRIAPSFINKHGKDPEVVGLGSFIVNGQADCNGCQTSDPANEYLPHNNPYLLPPNDYPAQYDQATYLAGGQNFGPAGPGVVKDPNSPLYGGPGLGPNIISRNLTPDYTHNPEGGNDFGTFKTIMRAGEDFDRLHPKLFQFRDGQLLQRP